MKITNPVRMCLRRALVSAAGLLFYSVAFGADYPTRPVRLIVPQPPGGGTDIVARLLAQKLSESLDQQFVVDNRSGAGGIVGTEIVAKSPPDGYTLLLGYTGSLTINPNIHKRLPYRPVDDFDPISLAVANPLLLVVHPSLRVATFAELVALAKTRSAPLNYGTPGNGSLHHLAMEWIKSATGVNFTHIPYKGNQSVSAVMAGEVSLAFVSVVSGMPHIKSDRVKAIAITGKSRSRALPDLPTVAESGIPGFEATNWFGILAPRRTPAPVISKLSSLIATSMRSADVKDRLLRDGAEPVGSTPEEFANLIRAELKRWGEVVKLSGAKVD
jgi:tripartite-type tricarboxylate transporter receptor subunit TctC